MYVCMIKIPFPLVVVVVDVFGFFPSTKIFFTMELLMPSNLGIYLHAQAK